MPESPKAMTTADMLPEDMQGEHGVMVASQRVLQSTRRPLVVAPSEGPIASELAEPSGDPTRSIGQDIFLVEPGRGAPLQLPTPARNTPASFMYEPATYQNPNHYEFANNLGGREERTALATIPQGQQLAYQLREDWRRPAPVQPAAEVPM